MESTSPRTEITDVILVDASDYLDEDGIEGLLDASISATQTAIENRDPLLDWEEYEEAIL